MARFARLARSASVAEFACTDTNGASVRGEGNWPEVLAVLVSSVTPPTEKAAGVAPISRANANASPDALRAPLLMRRPA